MKSTMTFKMTLIASAFALFAAESGLARESAVQHTGSKAVVVSNDITEAEVIAAQSAWGGALVQISKDFEEGGIKKARATANAVLDAAYGYNLGAVLFKPTLTTVPNTFRTTKEGALSYFVGDNSKYPQDTGFALKDWRSVEIKNVAIYLDGDTAMSMGNVIMTDKAGKLTTVDKTWGYTKDDQGTLRIVLHHSSLPVPGK